MSLNDKFKLYQGQVERALDEYLPPADTVPARLHEAIHYAVLAEGKRVRPILVYATGEAVGVTPARLDPCACAVEIIHAYSLVHDDLPAMDDDELRRGRPTCHIKYDEATAILVGDALQALAFDVLTDTDRLGVGAAQCLRMIQTLAVASGSQGMAGGQAIDLYSVGKQLSLEELKNMHNHKTGALIKASVELGALCSDTPDAEQLAGLSRYAGYIGLAFQIHDDVLDIEADTATLGKPQGSDQDSNKPTYPNLLGLVGAKQAAREMYDLAIAALGEFDGKADTLRQLAAYIVERKK
ncbi:MAG: (2E,6E)-farnesyl diphosphate synthase [Gammaproteobacteria bacterium]